ncbi:hypothetical protein DFH07DRAFT_766229 [Mycena maculata]|uniref:Uncharacterized protein n=1 Tax=Mycena maculata TaxID=230809 RepID=A0AAD7K657_9AGAR|nr:hypothetical protein DFH07DRAFT_766229 [Mycena maculata]
MTFLAVDILTRLVAHPSLAQNLKFTEIQRFRHRIWPEIVGKSSILPVVIPPHAAGLLLTVLNLRPDIIALSWLAFSDFAESYHINPPLGDGFQLHAVDHKIGPRHSSQKLGAEPLVPPVNLCPRSTCNKQTLTDP